MYHQQQRPQRPHIQPSPRLPPGARQPDIPSSRAAPGSFRFPEASQYTFQVADSDQQEHYEPLGNPWDNVPPPLPPKPATPRIRAVSQTSPYSNSTVPMISFPEPHIVRSSSHLQSGRPQQRLSHHASRVDLNQQKVDGNSLQALHQNPSVASLASSYVAGNDNYSYDGYDDYSPAVEKGLSDMLLESDEGLKSFQAGKLPEVDQQWHKLVPESAREALGKQEVKRQSVMFELIKAESEYVADLQAVEDVFIQPLRQANPPILAEPALSSFIQEVFGNFQEILLHHKRMLQALFERQREQHPLLQSIADIILDTTLKSAFRESYDIYVKRYPLAESHHRTQLKRNRAYEKFILSNGDDPRIRKRDLMTFLSRPVTRLPRMNLVLKESLKATDAEHPDMEALPIVIGILEDFVKSTQPGIEAAESKVKFWQLCESLVFQRGEVIDMDLYDESRSLIYTGPVMRRTKSETGLTEKWAELSAALLDNYFVLTKEEKRPNGNIKRLLVSRPMALAFLRIGSFDSPAETRKERMEEGGILDSFRSQNIPVYPFTIYHAANKSTRRYTLYVSSEAIRKKWHDAFVNGIGIHKVRQESNMWFNPQVITDGFFRSARLNAPSASGVSKLTGRIQCAAPFVIGGKRYLAVGCGPGVYVGPANSDQYHWAIEHKNPTSLQAVTTSGAKVFNRLVVHVESSLYSYSLDILVRLVQKQAQRQNVTSSIEKLAEDAHVVFCRHLNIGGRSLVLYASKRRLATTMNLHVLEAIDSTEQAIAPKRNAVAAAMRSFRAFGEYGYIPKDAYDAVPLAKTVGICTKEGIVIADPTSLAQSSVNVVPDFSDASNNAPMSTLKAMIGSQRPLGFVRVDTNELLVIYEELGCYINKHGIPTRKCGFVKWEAKAASYASRNGHVLLFSYEFIEIRNITTGRIVQVIEGIDIRLLYTGPQARKEDPVLIVMRGTKVDQDSQSEKIMELIETEEISVLSPTTAMPAMWDEWDM